MANKQARSEKGITRIAANPSNHPAANLPIGYMDRMYIYNRTVASLPQGSLVCEPKDFFQPVKLQRCEVSCLAAVDRAIVTALRMLVEVEPVALLFEERRHLSGMSWMHAVIIS
jgi:hypothetical protein